MAAPCMVPTRQKEISRQIVNVTQSLPGTDAVINTISPSSSQCPPRLSPTASPTAGTLLASSPLHTPAPTALTASTVEPLFTASASSSSLPTSRSLRISNIAKKAGRSLAAVFRRRRSTAREHDYIYTIAIETAELKGRSILAQVKLDTGCEWKGVVVSKDIAKKASLLDKPRCRELKKAEAILANKTGLHGYTSEGCTMRWVGSRAENGQDQRFFLPRNRFVESRFTIVDDLQYDAIIGGPEIGRLGLDQKRPPFFGAIPRPTTPDHSK